MSRKVITKPMKSTLLPSDSQNSNLRKTSKTLKQQPKETVQFKEEQKVLTLLENCFSQVEVALTLQPDHVADIKDISLCRALQRHQSLCERLERTEEQSGIVGKDGNDALFKSEVKRSYKNVMRGFRNAAADFAQIKQGLDTEMGKTEQVFYKNLQTIIHCTLEEAKEEEPMLKITPLQDRKSEVALDEKIANLTKLMSRIDENIEDCKASMDNLKIPQESETPLTDLTEYQSYVSTPEQQRLQQELDQLNAQLNKLFLEDRMKERDIQEGTDVLEAKIEYVTEEFDEKMEEIQADLEAREAELHKNEEELSSLAVLYNTLERQEKERMKEEMKQKNEEMLQSKKEADKIYAERQQLKAQKRKEDLQSLQDFHRTQMAEKHSKQQQHMQDTERFESYTVKNVCENYRE
ncbi:probable DNA double-strand break repair Rad50 ATPase [Boleophthalmus pectinirostris]|uniref:probable DNA double-strand break repair Rad50 ATPase n=1 Tax=Boleophthalmus pectinirostris TaxID=150288 RepID=UPI002431AF39|nr:probable DNA double-strand break repair Rad50 ATPase [Boleophthalmus pectinirostris]